MTCHGLGRPNVGRPDTSAYALGRRIRSLEAQALEPLKSREEMRGDAYPESAAVDNVLVGLRANREYVPFSGGLPRRSASMRNSSGRPLPHLNDGSWP